MSHRRLLFAAAASLLTLLAGLSVAAVGSADDGVTGNFMLAQRHAGDKGSWEIVLPEHESAPPSSSQSSLMGQASMAASASVTTSSQFSFEWLAEQAWRAGDGTWYSVHGLRTSGSGTLSMSAGDAKIEVKTWNIEWHDVQSGLIVGETNLGGGTASATSDMQGSRTELTLETITTWVPRVPCGLSDRLREGVDLEHPITVQGCLPSGSATFRATGIEDVRGIEAVRFEAAEDGTELAYYYNPGIPEPVRRVTVAEDTVSDIVLVSFEPGTGPWDSGLVLPKASPLPKIEVAPRQPWGPDDSGVDHPYPLSQAWKTSSQTDPAFLLFLQQDPAAWLLSAEYTLERRGSTTERQWDMRIVGSEEANVLSTQTEQYASSAVTDPLGLPPAGPTVSTTSSHTNTRERSDGADRPEHLPTIASSLRFYEAFTAEAGNAWQVRCQSCESPQVLVGALKEAPDSGRGSYNSTWIIFDADGTASGLLERQTYYANEGSTGSSVVLGAVAITSGRVLGSAMSLTPETGAASFLALLSGLVIWFWPTLKATPLMGLFSRVREDQLLDHPVRARVVARVSESPGIHYQELLRSVGGGKGSLEHHLRKLVDGRVLRAVRGPYYTCYFPWAATLADRNAASSLKSAGARQVLDAVRRHPDLSGQELCARTGLSASTVSEHVARLASAGLVEARREGRTLRVRAAA